MEDSEVFTSPTAAIVRHHDPSYPFPDMPFRLSASSHQRHGD